MQINLYGILSVALALLSIFHPWISSYTSYIYEYGMVAYSMDISPHIWSQEGAFCLPFCVTNSSLFSFDGSTEWKWMRWIPLPLRWNPTLIAQWIGMMSFLTYVYSICLITHSTFVNGSWGKAGKRIAMVGGILSLSSVLLYSTSLVTWVGGPFGISPLKNGFSTKDGMAIAQLTYFSTGFLLALLGASLAFLSWMRPKFINIPTRISIERYDKLRNTLDLPEKEKLLFIFLNCFLVVLVFTIYYFIGPMISMM